MLQTLEEQPVSIVRWLLVSLCLLLQNFPCLSQQIGPDMLQDLHRVLRPCNFLVSTHRLACDMMQRTFTVDAQGICMQELLRITTCPPRINVEGSTL